MSRADFLKSRLVPSAVKTQWMQTQWMQENEAVWRAQGAKVPGTAVS